MWDSEDALASRDWLRRPAMAATVQGAVLKIDDEEEEEGRGGRLLGRRDGEEDEEEDEEVMEVGG